MSLTRRHLCAALLASAVAGCQFFGASGPTTVAQGRHYATGNQQFDEYFVELYQFQVRLAEAPGELKSAREILAKAAETPPATPSAELAAALGSRLQKLVAKGVRVKLEVTAPEPPDPAQSSASVKHSGSPSSAERELLTQIEGALTALAKLRAQMTLAPPRLNELRLLAGQLDSQIDEAFDLGGAAKRREVRANLSDSVKVIALMLDRAKEVETQAGELLTLVVDQAGTDDGSVGSAPSPAPKPERAPSAPRSAPRPSPPPAKAAPAAKAEPPPPAPPPPAPAPPAPPPPKQGSKPADFEP